MKKLLVIALVYALSACTVVKGTEYGFKDLTNHNHMSFQEVDAQVDKLLKRDRSLKAIYVYRDDVIEGMNTTHMLTDAKDKDRVIGEYGTYEFLVYLTKSKEVVLEITDCVGYGKKYTVRPESGNNKYYVRTNYILNHLNFREYNRSESRDIMSGHVLGKYYLPLDKQLKLRRNR